MTTESIVETLTREHRAIDAALEGFVEHLQDGELDPDLVLGGLATLRRHIYLEEVHLFPPLSRGALMMPVTVMLREHGELWRTMDAIAESVAEAQAGGDSPRARERTRALCLELLAMLDRHNEKEEPVIYPQTPLLRADEAAALAAALASGAMPDGWTCHDAGTGDPATPGLTPPWSTGA